MGLLPIYRNQRVLFKAQIVLLFFSTGGWGAALMTRNFRVQWGDLNRVQILSRRSPLSGFCLPRVVAMVKATDFLHPVCVVVCSLFYRIPAGRGGELTCVRF